MSTQSIPRTDALALGRERKVARRLRTRRLRQVVAVCAAAAFVGPFATIYEEMAAGRDPALATVDKVASALAPDTSATAALGSNSLKARATAIERAKRRAAAAATDSTPTTTETQTQTVTPVQTSQS